MTMILTLLAACAATQADAKAVLEKADFHGGLVVHLGCGDGTLTADLRAQEGTLVHGLDPDPANVRKAREAIAARGLYGPVTVDRLEGNTLPYVDGFVNLLVTADPPAVPMDEIMRVLAPGGAVMLGKGGAWKKTVKPRTAEIDEWPYFLHGPDNNAVSNDRKVGPPRRLQWVGYPRFSRAHEQQASFSSCVTADGRMFYIVDEAPTVDIRLKPEWKLVARDAFSGVVLWKRPMGEWVDHLRRFRSGPASLQFRTATDGARLFVTMSFEGPVAVLDAVTGKTLRTLEGTEYSKQIIPHDGALYLLTDREVGELAKIDAARAHNTFIPHHCRILRVDPETGKTAWEKKVDELIFPCMALKGGRLFAQTTTRVFALDAGTGAENWSTTFKLVLPSRSNEPQHEAPTLVATDKAVLAADSKAIRAYGTEDGKELWNGPSSKGYNSSADVLIVDGLVWMNLRGREVGLDPVTGKEQRAISSLKGYMHDRCYRNKATPRFLLMGKMGVQMVDVKSGDIQMNDWIRGTCQYGVLPANGLLYVPPDSCACNMKTKLSGLYALAPERPIESDAADPLEKGPAFGRAEAVPASDWPTYRAGPERSSITDAKVPTELKEAWTAEIGGRLSGLSADGERLYVSAIDRHTLYALDRKSGRVAWTHVAGGRIDSPPTIHEGLVLFGSADGRVTALRATDGELAWRFRAAPADRRIFITGRLESPWPVHGSVLVRDGELFFTAGRSSYLDGGIHLFRMDPATGRVLSKALVFSPDPKTGAQTPGGGKDVHGALSDVLVADGDDVYMRHLKLDFKTGADDGTGVHMFSPIGILDDTWWHRSYWLVSDSFTSHWSGWWKKGNVVPSGRILACNGKEVYGFGRDKYPSGNTGQARGGEKYQLFAHERGSVAKPAAPPQPKGKKKRPTPQPPIAYRWSQQVPLLATGLVVTHDTVFAAGMPDTFRPGEGNPLRLEDPEGALESWSGNKGGVVYGAARSDGSRELMMEISAPPVFDGMAAVGDSLYLALKNGKVIRLSGDK